MVASALAAAANPYPHAFARRARAGWTLPARARSRTPDRAACSAMTGLPHRPALFGATCCRSRCRTCRAARADRSQAYRAPRAYAPALRLTMRSGRRPIGSAADSCTFFKPQCDAFRIGRYPAISGLARM